MVDAGEWDERLEISAFHHGARYIFVKHQLLVRLLLAAVVAGALPGGEVAEPR
jgi:hypothetical protein